MIRRRRLRALALAALLAPLVSGACALSGPIPEARVRAGPGASTPAKRLLALPTECHSSGEPCDAVMSRAIAISARMHLEYEGYRILDAETVQLRVRERVETLEIEGEKSKETIELSGATWEQATPADRRDVVAELGVDGVLETRIFIGPSKNADAQQTVQVWVRVLRAHDDELVWQSRCAAETGRFYRLSGALEHAVRCALEGAATAGVT